MKRILVTAALLLCSCSKPAPEGPLTIHCRIEEVSGAYHWEFMDGIEQSIVVVAPLCLDLLHGRQVEIRRLIGDEVMRQEGTLEGKKLTMSQPSPFGEFTEADITPTSARLTITTPPENIFAPVPPALVGAPQSLWHLRYECIESTRVDALCGGCCYDKLMPN